MTDLAALRERLIAPDSHAGGDCQCACFVEGYAAGVDAVLGALEQVDPAWCVTHRSIVFLHSVEVEPDCVIVPLYIVEAHQ